MYTLTIVLFSIIILTELVLSERNGAPPKSCRTMSPGHRGAILPLVAGRKQPSGYSFDAILDERSRMVRVTVTGKPVAGFLIQGRWSKDGPAVGRFINIIKGSGVRYQNCSDFKFDPESSVTHTDGKVDKENLVFYWQPPKTINKEKNVTFFATLAQTKDTFWVMQESNPLNLTALEDEKPTTKVERPTQNKAPNTASSGISLISIFLAIAIRISALEI